jgi:hypothetical protein
VLEALHDDAGLPAVRAVHVNRALDDLLDSTQEVTRTLLGVGVDPSQLPPGAAFRGRFTALNQARAAGWARVMPAAYQSDIVIESDDE